MGRSVHVPFHNICESRGMGRNSLEGFFGGSWEEVYWLMFLFIFCLIRRNVSLGGGGQLLER